RLDQPNPHPQRTVRTSGLGHHRAAPPARRAQPLAVSVRVPTTAELTGHGWACGGTVVAMAQNRDWEAMYTAEEAPPWDLGQVQPALVAFLDRTEVADPVLDAGCGTGALALLLAERGHSVTGFDLSATAIDRARARAAVQGMDVDLQVADAAQ